MVKDENTPLWEKCGKAYVAIFSPHAPAVEIWGLDPEPGDSATTLSLCHIPF